MAIDVGGIDYKIDTKADLSGLREFRRETQDARKEWAAFRREVNRTTKPRGVTQAATGVQQLGQSLQTLNSNQARAGLRNVSQGLTAINSAGERTRRSRQEVDRFTRSLNRSSTSGRRALFTFRRLVGVLAVFTAARQAANSLGFLTRRTIEFSAAVESSELGIASLLTAVGQTSDEFGNIVDGAEALDLALSASNQQIVELRKEALTTAATFEQLLDTFQIALAPGLTAGLGLDEIRQLTVRISQAATAIGLPQNQLAEEIRSLLSGTIQPRTTRIATALGITNEDIRNARELGNLGAFLEERFSAFGVAGERALQTFAALRTNAQAAIEEILRLAGVDFFASLKQQLDDIINTLVDFSSGEPIFNDDAVAIAREFLDVLTLAVEESRNIVDSLGIDRIEDSVTAIAALVEGIVAIAGPFISQLLLFVSGIGNILETFGLDDFSEDLGGILEIIGRLLAVVVLLKTTTKLITKSVAAISRLIPLIRAGVTGITAALGPVGLIFAVLSVLIPLAASQLENVTKEARQTADAVEDVEVSFKAASQAIKDSEKNLSKLRENAEGAAVSVGLINEGFGLTGTASSIFEARLKSSLAIFQQTVDLQEEANNLRGERNELERLLNREQQSNLEIGKLNQGITLSQATIAQALGEEYTFQEDTQKRITNLLVQEGRLNERILEIRKNINQQELDSTLSFFSRLITAQKSALGDAETSTITELLLEGSSDSITRARAFGSQLGISLTEGLSESSEDVLGPGLNALESLLNRIAEGTAPAGEATSDLFSSIAASALEASTALRNTEQTISQTRAEIENLESFIALSTDAFGSPIDVEAVEAAETTLGSLNVSLQTQLLTLNALKAQYAITFSQAQQDVANTGVSVQNLTEGLQSGFQTLAQEYSNAFSAGEDLAKQSASRIEGLFRNLWTDIFDPSSDTSIRERFGQFLLQLSADIISTFARLAIVRPLVGGLGSAFGGFFAADGGIVPGEAATPALRPAGVPASDTVNGWLTPGEGIVKLARMRQLGSDFINAINNGGIDPQALRAAAGLSSKARLAIPSSALQGYQTGGTVGSQTASGNSTPGVSLAILEESKRTTRGVLAGDLQETLRFFQSYGPSVRRALQVSASRS